MYRRNVSFKPYLSLLLLGCLLLFLPTSCGSQLRGATVSVVSPIWSVFRSVGEFFKSPLQSTRDSLYRWLIASEAPREAEWEQLRLENRRLRQELVQFHQKFAHEEKLLQLLQNPGSNRMAKCLNADIPTLPASVVYRSPESWGRHLWIGVGERDNAKLNQSIVQKGSPVVVGTALVGVVEEVEERRSLVRLITDPHLVPSVRAVRGGAQNAELGDLVDRLSERIQLRPDLQLPDRLGLLAQLSRLSEQLAEDRRVWFLAKGQIRGMGPALWNSSGQVLKGEGFNCNHADSLSPARDLSTGALLGENRGGAVPILQSGDLLVTTGLDGVFPEGLDVAIVSRVESLQEGASYYNLEARACAGDLLDLSTVYVLPPNM